ncbi:MULTISPECIES: ABC transporter ATP-binding protein [Bosea]|jgi:branched-chain amino acid transport system ATP-binding protein|uniref:ABC transporter ATP-binding protein n=1 Tax=Bosea rubneri TaxID=3075434 RepID=A0ABU3SGA4_9HYPH|nr:MULTISPECIES: ABC transporter ATP-binding protein [unclassified Bosea (in: a-proteobacteria)]MDU0343829.1 ABC transporter ATP-binding protein [Bosea sp. ZW T0_25]HEV7337122.1 ABC transporter ATP-binding protein [Bosea sp. (in: a-proteobacteria)]
MLAIEGLKVRYGAVEALKGISLRVGQGEVVTLIGGNGAGKSTLMRAIGGLVKVAGGAIRFEGRDIAGIKGHECVRLGIGHSPEGRMVFGDQSVRDNLVLGAYARRDEDGIEADIERYFGIFPRLAERQDQLAGTLSGGEQQMLAIARALMARPKLLLLDEPSLGLAPLIVREVFAVIRRLREEGMTILLVEQMANQALAVADRAYVIETGTITLAGTGAELLRDERVRSAYLGA